MQQAEQLAALLRRFDLRSHVNVIPVRLRTVADADEGGCASLRLHVNVHEHTRRQCRAMLDTSDAAARAACWQGDLLQLYTCAAMGGCTQQDAACQAATLDTLGKPCTLNRPCSGTRWRTPASSGRATTRCTGSWTSCRPPASPPPPASPGVRPSLMGSTAVGCHRWISSHGSCGGRHLQSAVGPGRALLARWLHIA